jgi:hypothetical protein
MIIARYALSAAAFVTLAACGQAPADQTTPDPGSLLTHDEMSRILLANTKVWKFTSTAGVSVKKLSIRFVEDGTSDNVMTDGPGAAPMLVTTIIVLIQDLGQDRHQVRLYCEHATGWSSATLDRWFSKPLTCQGGPVVTTVQPITLGTTRLIEGAHAPEVSGQTQSITLGANAPCRIELVSE